jgi:SAM-dependent methyltransferase
MEKMFGMGGQFTYLECNSCKALSLITIPENLGHYYPNNYYSFQGEKWLKNKLNLLRTNMAFGKPTLLGLFVKYVLGENFSLSAFASQKIPREAKILDVGCGSGSFLKSLSLMEYKNLAGIDPYLHKSLRVCADYRLDRKELANVQERYDVVTMNHSFEHMDQPLQVLRKIREILNPGGKLIIHIPVADSWAWKKYRTNWVNLDAPRHLFLHTETSIKIMAKDANFKLESVNYEGTAMQIVGSEQYQRGIPLASRRSYYSGGLMRWIGWIKSKKVQSKVDNLNRSGHADCAVFILT